MEKEYTQEILTEKVTQLFTELSQPFGPDAKTKWQQTITHYTEIISKGTKPQPAELKKVAKIETFIGTLEESLTELEKRANLGNETCATVDALTVNIQKLMRMVCIRHSKAYLTWPYLLPLLNILVRYKSLKKAALDSDDLMGRLMSELYIYIENVMCDAFATRRSLVKWFYNEDGNVYFKDVYNDKTLTEPIRLQQTNSKVLVDLGELLGDKHAYAYLEELGFLSVIKILEETLDSQRTAELTTKFDRLRTDYFGKHVPQTLLNSLKSSPLGQTLTLPSDLVTAQISKQEMDKVLRRAIQEVVTNVIKASVTTIVTAVCPQVVALLAFVPWGL